MDPLTRRQRPGRRRLVVDHLGAGDVVVPGEPPRRDQDREEAEPERQITSIGNISARLSERLKPISFRPSTWRRMPRKRIPGVWPISVQKRHEDAAGEEQPGDDQADHDARREPVASPPPKMVGMIDENSPEAIERKPNSRPASIAKATARVDEARLVRLGLVVAAAEHLVGDALEDVVERLGDPAHLPADVGDQAEALLGDRRADLGRVRRPARPASAPCRWTGSPPRPGRRSRCRARA